MLNFDGYNIPVHTQGALELWVSEGICPSGFLTAVLCNDLFGAVNRADSRNISALPEIVSFIYNEVPSNAWGNAQTMRDYAKVKALVRA